MLNKKAVVMLIGVVRAAHGADKCTPVEMQPSFEIVRGDEERVSIAAQPLSKLSLPIKASLPKESCLAECSKTCCMSTLALCFFVAEKTGCVKCMLRCCKCCK